MAAYSVIQCVLFALALSVLSVLALCIKRLYFHPLSKYPGPLLGRVTDLYAAYHAWKGDIHVDMFRQHERYGSHVRYAPGKVNINTAEALRDIYSGNNNFQKSPYYRVLRHGPANTLTMINKTEHARRRRIVSQGLSDATLRTHEPTVMAHIKKCFSLATKAPETVDDSHDGWTAPQNMSNWFNWMTFDVMGDVVFGMRYDLLGSPKNRIIPKAIEQSNVRVSVLLQCPGIRRFGRVDRWMFPKAIEARNQFLHFVNSLVGFVMKGTQGRTVVSALKAARDPITGDELTSKEILAEATTLCVAGADTTSSAMAATFFYLSTNPHVYTRLREEVCSVFNSADEIREGPELGRLVYLRACIDEALRMSPPTGISLYREVQAGGAIVGNENLPSGVEAGVPIYAIHHNEEYFPEPFKYRPERWLQGEPGITAETVKNARAAFCPFSLGTRGCVGKGMALLELRLAIAYAIFTVDFTAAKENKSLKGWGYPDEFPLEDHITGSKNGPFLHFKPRTV